MKRILLPAFVLLASQSFSQGGETCASATTITSLPYVNTGNTSSATDNYYASCPDVGGATGGKDLVYQYTTGATVEYVDISICQAVTDFDSKLMVYETTCTGTPYACQDDGCMSPAYTNAYNSVITNLMLNPSTTYYIVVDGYNGSGGSAGNYQLNVNVGAGPPHPDIPFVDSTSKLPTTVFHSGNAVGVTDMNSDGLDDIVRAQGNTTMFIEYQQPDGSFNELSFGSAAIGNPWGMCIGDINNDGFNDVLWGDDGATRILTSSLGTSFTSLDVSSATGAGFIFVQGANFFDINNDGKLDAFVCDDVAMPHIFLGNGSGSWTFDQTVMPLATVPSSDNSGNYASIWTDANNDDHPDLFITHCRQSVSSSTDPRRIDQIFLNNGDYSFTQDVTNFTGLRSGGQGWSTDFADFDNDGDLDAVVLQYDVNSLLLKNDGTGVFTNVIASSGISSTTSFFGMNVVCEDFNNDTYIDIFMSGDDHHMYINNGDFTFHEDLGGLVYSTYTVTSQAIGDLNHDGKMDIYASYCNVYNSPSSRQDKLFINGVTNGNHFITFNLQGIVSNRNGIGAKIKLYGPWGIQEREVRSGEAYGINNTFMKHFGLGTNNYVDSATIVWPSGTVDHLGAMSGDQFVTVIEGSHLTKVSNPESKLQIKAYPNPTTGMLTIDVPQFGTGSVLIRDLSGRIIYQTANVQRYNTIDMGRFDSGVYTYEVNTTKGRITGKFVKQ
jgi:hypothetical protein